MIERLERRQLLTAQLEGSLLRVNGTDGPDRIRLSINSGDLTVDQDGDQTVFKASDVDQILITAGDGDAEVLLLEDIRNATIQGGGGSDTLIGGDRDDVIEGGGGDDHLDGKLGSDVIFGGGGFDSADYRFREENLTLSINNKPDDGADGGSEGDNIRDDVERIVGGRGADRITGSSADNSITGRQGNDTISGGAGDDSLDGDEGRDSLLGGDGNDRLRGLEDPDELFGGEGNDTFNSADEGPDLVDGGPGNDTATEGDTQDDYQNVEDFPGRAVPEISVLRGGNGITEGQETIDFGDVQRGSNGREITFTVRNDGSGTLRLNGVTVPEGYTLTEGLAGKLGTDQSDTFTIRLDGTPVGRKDGSVKIANNDANEDPFTFLVTGRVEAPPTRPEIRVERGNDNIEDDNTSVGFGTVTRGANGPVRTFTVTNEGDGTLTLGNVQVPNGFTPVEDLANSLAAGASDTFAIRMNTNETGDFEGQVRFDNNDGNESPFNFFVSGRVNPPPVQPPEIAVSRGKEQISDDKTTISFGNTTQGSAGKTRTFTVRNTGQGDLTLGNVQLPAGYTLVENLRGRIAPGDSDTFAVRLDAGSVGTKNGEIRFSNNDNDENPFNIKVTGVVKPRKAPEIAVFVGKSAINDANGSAAFKKVTLGGKERIVKFTVRNTGDAALTLGKVRLPSGYRLEEGLSSKISPGKRDTFSVRLLSNSAGTKNGQITFGTNDGDENPFNFNVTGRVTAPDIGVQWGKQTINDGSNSAVDFGSVGNGTGVRTQTFRVVNSGDATLTLGKVRVPAGYKVTDGIARKLKPGATDSITVSLDGTAGAGTHSGRISIASSDPDEKAFDFAVTGRVIGVSGSVNGSGVLTLNGTAGADVIAITGTGSNVRVAANGNSQTFNGVKRIVVNAGDGNDKVSVGTALAASISGGNGNDSLTGGKGGDTLLGDGGDDRLTGGLGSDVLSGGDGKDVLNAQDGVSDRKVDGGPGADKVTSDPTDTKTGT